MGQSERSTSPPSMTTSRHGAERCSLGVIFSASRTRGSLCQASPRPCGGSGALSAASRRPSSVKPVSASMPNAAAIRSAVPNRFVRTRTLPRPAFVNNKAGPPCLRTRRLISVSSRFGSTGVTTVASSPLCASVSRKARRSANCACGLIQGDSTIIRTGYFRLAHGAFYGKRALCSFNSPRCTAQAMTSCC